MAVLQDISNVSISSNVPCISNKRLFSGAPNRPNTQNCSKKQKLSNMLEITEQQRKYSNIYPHLQLFTTEKHYKKYYSGNSFASQLDNIHCYKCQYFIPDEGHCDFSSQVPINQTSKQSNDFSRNHLKRFHKLSNYNDESLCKFISPHHITSLTYEMNYNQRNNDNLEKIVRIADAAIKYRKS